MSSRGPAKPATRDPHKQAVMLHGMFNGVADKFAAQTFRDDTITNTSTSTSTNTSTKNHLTARDFSNTIRAMNERLGFSLEKPIVMVGLMGAGKTSSGRMLARKLDIPFIDLDKEIESAAGCSVVDIFSLYGEEEFRRVEERVFERLLTSPPALKVISTGEGAFITNNVRQLALEKSLTIWLRADLELLVKRTNFRDTRPQLLNTDSKKILSQLIDERYKIYEKADITVQTADENLTRTLQKVMSALKKYNKT